MAEFMGDDTVHLRRAQRPVVDKTAIENLARTTVDVINIAAGVTTDRASCNSRRICARNTRCRGENLGSAERFIGSAHHLPPGNVGRRERPPFDIGRERRSWLTWHPYGIIGAEWAQRLDWRIV